MTTQEIVAALDAEIERLQQVRNILAGSPEAKRRGRPPMAGARKAKRTLSAEARKKIADAQRKRWAKQKQVAVTKLPPKGPPLKRQKRRGAATKTKSALTSKVPSGPVAASAPNK